MKNIFYSLLFLFAMPLLGNAQANENLMYSSGRIYVVVAVLLAIFIGIIFYLIKIDRKIDKLKKGDH